MGLLDKVESTEKDIKKAIYYLELAADAGSINAHLSLANLYSSGEHMPPDFEKSLKYNIMAIKLGSAQAKFN